MVDNILDAPLSAAEATAFVRSTFEQAPDPATFTLANILPTVQVDDFKAKIRTSSRTIHTARWRVFDARTPMGKRAETLRTEAWKFAPLGQILSLGEEDTRNYFQRGGTSVQEVIFDLLEDSTLAVLAALEMARGQILSTGVAALPLEDGTTIAADFMFDDTHKPTAAVAWSNPATATPWSDERAWLKQIRDDKGTPPLVKVMSETVASYLQANLEYREAYASIANLANTPSLLDPTQVDTVRQRWNLPVAVINDAVDGAGNRFWPEDKVGYFGANVGETQMGTTAEALMLQGGTNPRLAGVPAPGLVGVIEQNFDPARIDTKVSAVGLPMIFDKNSVLVADVLA